MKRDSDGFCWSKINVLFVVIIVFFGIVSSAWALREEDAMGKKEWFGDFDKMVEKRGLRVLIPYNKTFYFLDGATEKGLSYDAVTSFEKQINKKLKTKNLKFHVFIIPTERELLLPHIKKGFGDIAIGNLTITDERMQSVDFSDPFLSNVREIVVTRKNGPKLKNSFDLAGKEIYVRESSSYHESLLKLNEVLKSVGKKTVKLTLADPHLEDADLLEMLDAGVIPMLIVDNHKAEFWAKILNNIQLHQDVAVHSEGKIAWAVRKNSPKLQAVINEFVKTNKKGTLHGNMALNKYLKSTKYISNPGAKKDRENFKNVVEYFKVYGKKYDFNYLLLTALAFQESRLNQSAKSRVGAVGVMQILPSTAKDKNVGIPNIKEVEANIHAGTKYLRFMADRYFSDEGINRLNRGLLSFASYNAGPAKIARLRKEAKEMGLDPNVWFGNVEVVAAKRIGRETVQYVSNIYKYYVVYSLLAKQGKL
ncbi:MAG: lytic transglycosylase F [Desulfocapsa sp.]|nr:lytic transglycosylase F [Desulfocapsa sp.]